MKTKRLCSFIYLLFVFSIKLTAQGQANFWYFGHYAGLNFNPGAPVSVSDGALYTLEGCATISDSAGNLLFYTDGSTVWNKLHVPMLNGTGLYGDPSTTQSGVIVPKPGTPTTFYIFTAAAAGGPAGLCYSEVDMTLHGGTGDVTALKNIFLYSGVSEKLTAVKNFDGINYWMIAHNNATNKYLVFGVTSLGVTTTPIMSVTGSMDGTYSGAGYLKASAGGGKLVAAFSGADIIDVLDFDNSTGAVSFNFSISLPDPYGVEFSRNERRLYAASWSSPNIVQYDMTLGSPTAIAASATIVGTASVGQVGSLQNAPDGKMYVAKYGASSLGCITNPNALGLDCGYLDVGINIPARMSTYGLPNFMPRDFDGSAIDYTSICAGDSTFFSLADSITIDSIHWNFGDPLSGAANDAYSYSAGHIFSTPGNYIVSVITYLDVAVDTSISVVNIFGPPDVFTGSDTAICEGKFMTIDAGPGYTYLWQDGSTNQTFHAAAGGTYYVTATGVCGAITDTIHIAAIPAPIVVVSNDTICSGETAHLIANGADSYIWPSNAVGSDSTAMPSPLYSMNYIVTGTTGMCSAKDTATVKVNPIPVITATGATICEGDQATITASGATTYIWSTMGTTASIDVTPVVTMGYSVIGSTGGCSDTAATTVIVNPAPLATINSNVSILEGGTVALSSSGGGSYDWSPVTGLSCTNCPDPIATPSETTTYCVEVNNGICTDTACTTVTVIMPCQDVAEFQLVNAFTPNNDGNNDQFFLQGWNGCIKKFSIIIYDRWSEMVFESDNVNFSWDGTYKGKPLDPAVFVYYIRAELITHKSIERKGNVTLLR